MFEGDVVQRVMRERAKTAGMMSAASRQAREELYNLKQEKEDRMLRLERQQQEMGADLEVMQKRVSQLTTTVDELNQLVKATHEGNFRYIADQIKTINEKIEALLDGTGVKLS